MITKETLDHMDKDLDDMLEKATPEELMLDLMEIRAKEYLSNHTMRMERNLRIVEILAGFATEQVMKAKREWNLQQISDFGQLQTALEELEKCKNKQI